MASKFAGDFRSGFKRIRVPRVPSMHPPEILAKIEKTKRSTAAHELGVSLACAALAGDQGKLWDLLQKGAQTSTRDSLGMTALMHASSRKDHGVARMLLAAGADPSLGATPAQMRDRMDSTIFNMGPSNRPGSPIFLGARDLEMTQLLLEAGADADCEQADGSTPLMSAITGGRKDCALALIRAGADSSKLAPITRAGAHVRIWLDKYADPGVRSFLKAIELARNEEKELREAWKPKPGQARISVRI